MAKDDFKHEIINIIGTISEGKKGWKKELTRISWNGVHDALVNAQASGRFAAPSSLRRRR